MASKRAYIDGTLKVTAASDFFTQDVEDFQNEAPVEENGTETVDVKPVRVEKPSTPDINTAPTLDHLYRDCLKLIEERHHRSSRCQLPQVNRGSE